MLDSYFFIPGDKDKFLSKINEITADYIVIDLEDAVADSNKAVALAKVLSIKIKSNYYVRIPFNESYSPEELKKLFRHFNGKVVIPKLENSKTLSHLLKLSEGIKLSIIVLIETPKGYMNLSDILHQHHHSISGLGFGTHDFCSIMGIKHNHENLYQYKRDIMVKVKAFGIKFIDGVDLNLKQFDTFVQECQFAYSIGADGKFLIHPQQLEVLNSISFLSDEEIAEIQNVYEKIKNIDPKDITVYVVDGKVYEKPHINRILKIISKLNNQKNI